MFGEQVLATQSDDEASSTKIDAFGRYMAGLSDGDGAVHVASVDLMDVHMLAPNIMLLDVIEGAPGKRIRFMGTALVAIYGIEATNRNIDDVAMGPHKQSIREMQRLSIVRRRPVWSKAVQRILVGTDSLYADGRCSVLERLVWPLVGDEGQVVRLAEIVDRVVIPGRHEAFSHNVVATEDFFA